MKPKKNISNNKLQFDTSARGENSKHTHWWVEVDCNDPETRNGLIPPFQLDDTPRLRLPNAKENWPFLQEGAALGALQGADKIKTLLIDGFESRTGAAVAKGDLSVFPCLQFDSGGPYLSGDLWVIGFIANGLGWASVPAGPLDPEYSNSLRATTHIKVVLRCYGIEIESCGSDDHVYRFRSTGPCSLEGPVDRLQNHLWDATRPYGAEVRELSVDGGILHLEIGPNESPLRSVSSGQTMVPDFSRGPRPKEPLGRWAMHHFDQVTLFDQGYLLGESVCPGCVAELLDDACSFQAQGRSLAPIRRAPCGKAEIAETHPFTSGFLNAVSVGPPVDVGDRTLEHLNMEMAANHLCAVLELFGMEPHVQHFSSSRCAISPKGECPEMWQHSTVGRHLARAAEHHEVFLRFEHDSSLHLSRRDESSEVSPLN